jgi:hypothetical protein
MGKHVFLSYKHQETAFANELVQRLTAVGFQLWVDAEQLRAGENWRETINLAIKDAFALVVIITPDSKTSEYVTYEWAFAQGAGIKIVPVLLRATKLHPQLEILQYLDFTDPYVQPWERLIARLKELQGQFQTNTLSLPSDAPNPVRSAVTALDSHNADDRRSALRTLAQINHPAAYTALVNAVAHPMRDVRVDAAFMLAKQSNNKDTAAVPGLIEALYDEDGRIRTAAVKVLGEIGDPNAVTEFLTLLNKENDGNIRWAVTAALGRMGKTAVPGLIEALRDENWKVRRSAAEALWALGEPEAVAGLVVALNDRNDVVRQAASSALEAMATMAVPELIKALPNRDRNIGRAAAEMLERIGTSDALAAVEQWKREQGKTKSYHS